MRHTPARPLAASPGVATRPSAWEGWWRWVWLIAFFGGLLFTVRGAETISAAPLQLEVIHRPIIAVIVGLLVVPWITWRPSVMFQGVSGLLVVFALWRLSSTLWSPNSIWTLYRSLEYLVIVGLTAYTAASLRNLADLRKWMNWQWAWMGLLVASAWMGLLVFPAQAIEIIAGDTVMPFRLHGAFPIINPLLLGTIAGILAIVGINRLLGGEGRRGLWLLLVFIGIATLVMTQARSSLAGFFLGLVLLLLFRRRFGLTISLAFVAVISVSTFSLDSYLWDYLRRGQTPEVFFGFTGRTFYWERVWEQFLSVNLWLGSGAFAASRFVFLDALPGSAAPSVDNTWIEVAGEIGLFGPALLAAILVWIWWVLVKAAWTGKGFAHQLSVEMVGVLAILTVRSFFVNEFIWHISYAFFLAVGSAACLARLSTSNSVTSREEEYCARPYGA